MKVLITCVCYNNFFDALRYINSISKALVSAPSVKTVDLYLVNNGVAFTTTQLSKIYISDLFNVQIIENQSNNGYFPGCFVGYKKAVLNNTNYDAMLVTNVDLKVTENFFEKLVSLKSTYKEEPKIIAPSIVSLSENKDRNPKVKIRFSKKQMQKYLLLYTIPYLHLLYKKTLYKSKIKPTKSANGCSIYAPHGSFVVFLGGAKNWEDILNYPVFLFGEEIHIGEQARIHGIPVKYHQELKVIDSDHASTGKENEGFIRKHNLKAISYLYNRYWNTNV